MSGDEQEKPMQRTDEASMPGDEQEKPKPPRWRLTDDAVSAIVDLFSGKLKRSSPEASDAWRHVSSCLRHWESVDLALRVWMINMTNPDMRDSMPMRFEVVPNPEGVDRAKEKEIAEFIGESDGVAKMMAAYAAAAEKFDISYSQAEKIWSNWKSMIRMLKKRKKPDP